MIDETSPAARALSTLELIQTSPGITAERLSARLGVSERAVRRYVGILRDADIPIEATRGPYGGYRVGRALRPPPLMFSATEALGLVMAVLDGHHRTDDPDDPVASALAKIIRILPEPVAGPAETMRTTAAAAPDRGAVRPDPAATATLVRACSTGQRVAMTYRSEAGAEWRSEVDPWAIVVRHGRWYLLCWSHAVSARRAYRIDRMADVELLAARSDPPVDLDPVAVLEDHLAVGWEYAAEVVFAAGIDDVRPWVSRAIGRLEAVDEQTTRLVGTTSNPYWYVRQLVPIPLRFRVAGGDEVRQAAGDLGRQLLAAVAAETSPGSESGRG